MNIHANIIDLRVFYRIIALAVAATIMDYQTSKAQFTIIDDLRGNNYPHIKVGGGDIPAQGEAYFTSGIDDPVGSGWLRLTRDQNNQRGYAYIDRSFPSGMGVLVDFEYKMWRSYSDGTYNGADGLSVFLFDATEDFRLGGYGGSLGYAPNTAGGVSEGLAGGYVGVGFDAYGNFSNPTEGRNGGSGRTPNSIALRGPTTDGSSPTNEYLDGTQLSGNVTDDELDYNTLVTKRPSSDVFYRRVQITIMYNPGTGFYDITVRWVKAPGDTFTELITYQTTVPPPPIMKVGFAASTGSGFNYHEIRNILVTTLGNLRTVKLADRDFLIPTNAGGAGTNENEISYTIEVVNDTDADIENIVLRDTIKDAYGNVLTGSTFDITGITVLDGDVLTATSPIQETSTNVLSGTVKIAAKKTGRIRVTGTLHQTPPGNHIINTVILYPPEGTDNIDEDLLNNISSIRTPVYADGVDLILGDIIPDERCISYADGNSFTVQVSNLGTDDVNVDVNKITVFITHPAGITFESLNQGTTRWNLIADSPTSHTFRLDNPSVTTLRRGFTHPDAIRFRLTPQPTSISELSSYIVSATVTQADENGNNQGNNSSEASVYNCTVSSNPMIRQQVKWY